MDRTTCVAMQSIFQAQFYEWIENFEHKLFYSFFRTLKKLVKIHFVAINVGVRDSIFFVAEGFNDDMETSYIAYVSRPFPHILRQEN